MVARPTGLADRLRAKKSPQQAVTCKPTKEQKMLAWIDSRIRGLQEFSKTVGIDDQKETKSTTVSDPMGKAGQAAVDTAVEAGYAKPGAVTTRSCKVFWIGANTLRRSKQARLDSDKMMQVLCNAIKENLRDC